MIYNYFIKSKGCKCSKTSEFTINNKIIKTHYNQITNKFI